MGTIYDQLSLIGPRVLVRPLPDIEISAGGIVKPDSARHTQNRGIVERVGPGELMPHGRRRPMTLAVGDLAFYQKFAGTWVVLDELERLMLMEDEIQALVPAAGFTLVTHKTDDRVTHEHLEGDPCLMCLEPREAESKANLAAMREQLRQPSPVLEISPAGASAPLDE